MKKKLLALLFGSALVLAACGGGGDESGGDTGGDTGGTDTADAGGETIYKQNCASCHGGNLEGLSGPELSAIGGKYSQEEIENVIANGQGIMPAKIVDGDDAAAVAAWLAEKK